MAREALSRKDYIDAALIVVDEVGADNLSMRRVAKHLNVSAMAIYKHFPGKDQLMMAALDEFIIRANVLPHEGLPWDQWAEEVARRMYHALCGELSWVPMLGSLRLGAQAADVSSTFVQKLVAGGFTVVLAVRGYYAVIQVVVGAVCLRSSLQPDKQLGESGSIGLAGVMQNFLEQVDLDSLSIVPALEEISQRDQIDIALPLVMDAMRAQLAGLNTEKKSTV